MVIAKLMGGLGNQLFQYATARRLAHVSGTPLKLDLGWFKINPTGITSRRYGLEAFAIAGERATPEEIEPFLLGFNKLLGHFGMSMSRRFYIKEKMFSFQPQVMKPRPNVYLDGYWQSERYFADIAGIIRAELTVKTELQDMNRELAVLLREGGEHTVAVHVRRGDYVTNPEISNFHGTCSPAYYHAAFGRLRKLVPDPHFLVFSDEPEWVKDHFRLPGNHTFVNHNSPEVPEEDLRLMSRCRHHIIANSTFSWWGAWLCDNPEKIVIAPKKWFNSPGMDTKDLIPTTWTRI